MSKFVMILGKNEFCVEVMRTGKIVSVEIALKRKPLTVTFVQCSFKGNSFFWQVVCFALGCSQTFISIKTSTVQIPNNSKVCLEMF